MTDKDDESVQRIAELEVRRYFDYYLTNIWPQQVQELRDQITTSVTIHNDNRESHGGVESKVNRALWWVGGASAVVGLLGGALLSPLEKLIGL